MVQVYLEGQFLVIDGEQAPNVGVHATRPFHNFVKVSDCSFSEEALSILRNTEEKRATRGNVGTYADDQDSYFFWYGSPKQTLNKDYLRSLAGTDWQVLP